MVAGKRTSSLEDISHASSATAAMSLRAARAVRWPMPPWRSAAARRDRAPSAATVMPCQ